MLVINQRVILLDWCGPLSTAADTSSGSRMGRMNHSDTQADKCISHSINKWHWSWKLLVVTACATLSRQSKWTIWFRTWSCFCQHSSTGQVRHQEHIEWEPAENYSLNILWVRELAMNIDINDQFFKNILDFLDFNLVTKLYWKHRKRVESVWHWRNVKVFFLSTLVRTRIIVTKYCYNILHQYIYWRFSSGCLQVLTFLANLYKI